MLCGSLELSVWHKVCILDSAIHSPGENSIADGRYRYGPKLPGARLLMISQLIRLILPRCWPS